MLPPEQRRDPPPKIPKVFLLSFEIPEVLPAPTRRSNRRHTGARPEAAAVLESAVLPSESPDPSLIDSVALAATALLAEAAAPEAAPLTRRAARAAAARAAAQVPAPVTEAVSDAAPSLDQASGGTAANEESSSRDAFAEASRVFLDAETSSVPDAATSAAAECVAISVAPPVRRRPLRTVVAAGSTAAVMGVTALLAVSLTVPSSAVAAAQGHRAFSSVTSPQNRAAEAPIIEDDEIQAFVAPEHIVAESVDRPGEHYSTVSLAEVAGQQGINYSDALYSNDPNAAIQWPYMVGVAMSSPYGPRRGAMHEGIDLVPGNGAPIQAIADGVVRIASEAGGAYGVHVWIDHVIDGQSVSSHYAHMQYGSLQVRAGQEVKVGDTLGKTGNTGRSYGAHLHFEIAVNGTKVDPLPWMQENAGRYEY